MSLLPMMRERKTQAGTRDVVSLPPSAASWTLNRSDVDGIWQGVRTLRRSSAKICVAFLISVTLILCQHVCISTLPELSRSLMSQVAQRY